MKNDRQTFFGEFLADRDVAAVQPSSKKLARRILNHLAGKNIAAVIEFGAGTGAATIPLLNFLTEDVRYFAVEKNTAFAAKLRVIGEPRLTVIEADARDAEKALSESGADRADVILASLPFTYLSHEERDHLVRSAKKRLKPDGIFIVFHQYTPLMFFYLKKYFPLVKTEFEVFNILPCFIFVCRK